MRSCGIIVLALAWLVGGAQAQPTPAAGSAGADSVRSSVYDSAAAVARAESARVAAPPPESEAAAETAILPPSRRIYLGGATILEIRDPLGHPSLDARASAIQARLLAVARDPQLPLDGIAAVRTPYGARLMLGSRLLFHITRRDMLSAEAQPPADLAEELVPAIRSGLERERDRLRPGYLARSSLIALAILLVYVLLARAALAWGRRAANFVGYRVAALLRLTPLRALGFFGPTRLVSFFERLGAGVVVVGIFAIGYAALSIVFSLFPWTQGWSHRLIALAQRGFATTWIAVAAATPRLLAVVAILYAARFVIKFMELVLDAAARGAFAIPGLHPELARPTKQLLRVFLWVSAVVIIYPLLPGSETPAFRGVSILLGAVVSLGSSGLIQDLLAGLVLIYSRSYRVGERIGTSGIVGDVVTLGLVTTRVRTIKNEEVTIGNSQVLRTSVTNYSRLAQEGPGLILHTSVTIGYDAPWPTVHRLLIEAALATEGIEREPEPFVLQRALSDFYVEYEINATTRHADRSAVLYGLLHQNIQDSFQRAGVEIMSPHYRSLRDGNASTVPGAVAERSAPPPAKGPPSGAKG